MPDSSARPERDTIDVLICDDADALRRLLRVVVGLDPDIRVAGEARNGLEAITQAEELQPDVILLDLSMPVLTGLEALPRIKAVAPAARVIALTGFSGSIVEEVVLCAGADHFLDKGAHPDAIVLAIKEAHAAARDREEGKRRAPVSASQ
jgi:DNA-binding NarL/FixJ family response regulator